VKSDSLMPEASRSWPSLPSSYRRVVPAVSVPNTSNYQLALQRGWYVHSLHCSDHCHGRLLSKQKTSRTMKMTTTISKNDTFVHTSPELRPRTSSKTTKQT